MKQSQNSLTGTSEGMKKASMEAGEAAMERLLTKYKQRQKRSQDKK
jgi:hypothetical protein